MLSPDFWIKQTAYFVALCICFVIFRKEYKKKTNETYGETKNIYQLWLFRWSYLTFITVIIYLFTNITSNLSPDICIYVGRLSPPIYNLMNVFFTNYQICRLQYCFDSKQIHSKKYGYPKSLFIFLYLFGILIQILFCVHYLIINSIEATTRGCSIVRDPKLDTWLLAIISGMNGIWTLTILGLYIFKTIQIKNKKQSTAQLSAASASKNSNDSNGTNNQHVPNNHTRHVPNGGNSRTTENQRIFRRINYIVFKLFILTILYQIENIVVVVTWQMTNGVNFSYSIVIMQLGPICLCIIMYLMIEHNDNEYIKLLIILKKLHICCCFRSLINEFIAEHKQRIQESHNEIPEINLNVDTIDTRTNHLNVLPQPIEQPVSGGEETLTINVNM